MTGSISSRLAVAPAALLLEPRIPALEPPEQQGEMLGSVPTSQKMEAYGLHHHFLSVTSIKHFYKTAE